MFARQRREEHQAAVRLVGRPLMLILAPRSVPLLAAPVDAPRGFKVDVYLSGAVLVDRHAIHLDLVDFRAVVGVVVQ